ncbi:hypothetical protein [Wolinella succinogenes]|nr:hypothetical protein [Wolinella succinogenes]
MELFESAILGGFLLLAIWILYKQIFSRGGDCGCGGGKSCSGKSKKLP